jgi:hypothetical protein
MEMITNVKTSHNELAFVILMTTVNHTYKSKLPINGYSKTTLKMLFQPVTILSMLLN